MDYKEFEYICFHMNIGHNKERTKLYFQFDVNSEHQRNIVEKYMNMKPDEFEKFWFPLCEKQKLVREQRLEEFKKLNSTDFSDMPLEKKLQYIDAITATNRTAEEWASYFTEVQGNLKACLFSMQPSKKFLLEEQRNLNHFMNALMGTEMVTLFGNGLVKRMKETKNRTPEQRKEDMLDFIHLFSQAYKIPQPELRFGDFPNAKTRLGECFIENNKSVINIHEKLLQDNDANCFTNFGVLFHELTHAKQNYWATTYDEKYSLYAKMFCALDKLISDKALNVNIYVLQPREGHAYYMEQKFEEQLNERVFDGKLTQKGLRFQVTRTLWYDYQGR